MDEKLFWTLALVGIVIVIGTADGCKHGGRHWCPCDGGAQLSSAPRSWQMERSLQPTPITLSLPMMQPQPVAPVCPYCAGHSREFREYTPRSEAMHSRELRGRGYYCRCSPRRQHYRYNDY